MNRPLRLLLALPLLFAGLAAGAASAHEAPLPAGWTFTRNAPATDDYAAGITDTDSHRGASCAYLKSGLRSPVGWGYVNQLIQAGRYRGKRLRFSTWLKAIDVRGEAMVWMRVDGADHEVLAFDAMNRRRVKGTSGWKRYDIVLDVPAASEVITFGVALRGQGAVCFDDFSFEPVDRSVPLTSRVGP